MASARNRRERPEPEPPYNTELVLALLGAVLYDPAIYPRVRGLLKGDDLYSSDRAVWEACDAIADGGDTPDEYSVTEWLDRHERLGEVNGGALAIQQLSTAVSPEYGHMVEQWARGILEDSERRTLIALGQAQALVGYYPAVAAYRADMEKQQRRLVDIQRRKRGEGSAAPAFEPLGVSMADVTVETFDWLWHGRIAFGKLTTFDGDGGIGKSLATIDLVARAVMGRSMPDGSRGLAEPTGAILICGEDGLADTVAPRLLAAGVSPEAIGRVQAINLVPEPLASGEVSQHLLSLLDDLPRLEATIEMLGARVMIIDPITAYLGDGIDMYKDSQVRRVLTPLALMAERRGLAVVMTRHLNRSNGASAQHRGLGSVAFLNVARLGLLFAPNPDTEGEVLVSRYKGNITAPPPTLAYRIVQMGDNENMPYLRWLGERETSAETALVSHMSAVDGEERTATEEAVEWLSAHLADGPHPAREVKAAARADGISDKTLRTARLRICKKSHKEGMRGGWNWELDPEKMPSFDERASSAGKGSASPESKPTPPKMPSADDEGHLRTETSPKMPTYTDAGHLRADAVECSDGDMSEGKNPPKMPSPQEKDIFGSDVHVCAVTGGDHEYNTIYRTANGTPLCLRCDQPEAPVGV